MSQTTQAKTQNAEKTWCQTVSELNDIARKKVFQLAIFHKLYDRDVPASARQVIDGLHNIVVSKNDFGESLRISEGVQNLQPEIKKALFEACANMRFIPSCRQENTHTLATIEVPIYPDQKFVLEMTFYKTRLNDGLIPEDISKDCHRNFTLFMPEEA